MADTVEKTDEVLQAEEDDRIVDEQLKRLTAEISLVAYYAVSALRIGHALIGSYCSGESLQFKELDNYYGALRRLLESLEPYCDDNVGQALNVLGELLEDL